MNATAEIVLDASAAVRGLTWADSTAAEIVDDVVAGDTVVSAPDLIVPEVANALRTRIHAERWPVEAAAERLETFLAWPLAIQPSGPLAAAALEAAARLRISAYDAFYAVLAAELEIPLVTADRTLAAAVAGAVLVS